MINSAKSGPVSEIAIPDCATLHPGYEQRADGWSDCVRRSSQSEGGRRKRYPSITCRGADGFRGAQPAQVICPSGCLSTGVSSLISDFPKNISVPTHPKSHLELSPSHPT